MTVKINLPPFFRRYTNDRGVIEVTGNTVSQCIADLVRQFPSTESMLFSNDGTLQRHINVYTDGEILNPEELDQPVKPGEEISILFIIEGG